jgi:hypothetical protein
MPDPISSNVDPTLPPEITNEENEARMSLVSAHPSDPNPSVAAPPAPHAPPSPAVSTLVSRFTPSGAHPPVEPSLGKALLNCKLQLANYLINLGATAAAAVESGGVSLLSLGKTAGAAAGVQVCIAQNEAQQVADGARANRAADCRAAGATPLTTPDNSVVCVK